MPPAAVAQRGISISELDSQHAVLTWPGPRASCPRSTEIVRLEYQR
jgi:hypothetical protein